MAAAPTIRCSDYAEFGTQELSDVMLKALEDRSACLLGNHGQIAFGPNLEKALWRAGEVETICAPVLGGTPGRQAGASSAKAR